MLLLRSTPIFASREPEFKSNIPPVLSTRPGARPKGTVPPLLPHHQSFGVARGSSPSSTAPTLFQNLGMPNASSGDTRRSASFGPSTTEGNSYHHGLTFRYIPLPPKSSSTAVSSTVPASFDFNQQKGNLSDKELPASGPDPFHFKCQRSKISEQ